MIIRRCRVNVEAWRLDTGADMFGPTAMSLDSLVQIIAGYESGYWPGEIALRIDRAAEHAAGQARMRREADILAEEARRIGAERRRLAALISP